MVLLRKTWKVKAPVCTGRQDFSPHLTECHARIQFAVPSSPSRLPRPIHRLQVINDNQPNQETLHKSSKWFSQLTFSTPPRPLRPASTSSRHSCPLPAPSSWTSSAPDASPSPPSSRTPTQSSCARAARRSCASPLVARRG